MPYSFEFFSEARLFCLDSKIHLLIFCGEVLYGISLSLDLGLNYCVHLSIAFIFMLRCTSGNTLCSMVLWDKGLDLEVLIFCHHVHVLYMCFFSPSLCRDTEWGCLRWPEQIPVPCGHHPLAWHYQEPPGWTAGGAIQQQQPRMWVSHMGGNQCNQ